MSFFCCRQQQFSNKTNKVYTVGHVNDAKIPEIAMPILGIETHSTGRQNSDQTIGPLAEGVSKYGIDYYRHAQNAA